MPTIRQGRRAPAGRKPAGLPQPSKAIPEAENSDGAKILVDLYSAELCECDVATLTGLPEHEVIRRLRTYTERGVLAHRTLHDMNYFRLASEKVRRAIDDATTAFKE